MNERLDALRSRQLTDDEAQMLADHEQPGWAARDLGARSIAPVAYVDGEIEIRSPRTLEGGVTVDWADEVIGTVGAGGDSPQEAREAFASFCARFYEAHKSHDPWPSKE
jgi:predicted NUDIX family NTP pyrophosphohydrolase